MMRAGGDVLWDVGGDAAGAAGWVNGLYRQNWRVGA